MVVHCNFSRSVCLRLVMLHDSRIHIQTSYRARPMLRSLKERERERKETGGESDSEADVVVVGGGITLVPFLLLSSLVYLAW
jgi:hypothetical protein